MSLKQSKKAITKALSDVRAYRGPRVQVDFWPMFGITQSGGSRYEKDNRQMGKPLRMLMALHAAGKVTDQELVEIASLV